MKRHTKNQTLSIFILSLAMVLFQNCGKVTFSADPNGGGVTPFCVDTLEETTAKLKIFFMLDVSGSTFGNDGTDPARTFRSGTIQSFIDRFASKPNLSYGLGLFSDSDKGFIYDSPSDTFKANVSNPFGGAAMLSSGLALFKRQTYDLQGRTDYRAAFSAMERAIITDENAFPNIYDYVVVFMSDGKPNPAETDAGLVDIVQDLAQAVKNRGSDVTVSSVYFGPRTDTEAIDNVKLVAREGKGQFVDTNTLGGADLSIADIVTIPTQSCSH